MPVDRTHTLETPRSRLSPTVKLLGWVSFFSDVSSEMAYPLLPLFVTGVLGAGGAELGVIEGLNAVMVALLTGWAGRHSDAKRGGRPRRVRFVRWGYALPVVGKAIVAGAISWPMVLVGRSIDRVGKGLRGAPRDALIADATRPQDRGRAFGFHRAMDTGGAFVGVVAAAGILWWMGASQGESMSTGIRAILILSAGVGAASVVCTLFLRETAQANSAEGHGSARSDDTPPDRSDIQEVAAEADAEGGLGRRYWWTLTPLLLFAMANSSDAFILLLAADLGLTPLSLVLAYALYNLSYTLASYPAGVLSDRIGKWRMIAGGWLLYAAAYAGFAQAGGSAIWGLMALYGVYAAMTEGVGKALVSNVAPPGRRGTALGVLSMSIGLVMLAASVVAGVLWDRVSHAAPFWFGATISVLAVATIPLAHRAAGRARAPGHSAHTGVPVR
ncbi:MAG: MFS transporter [Leptolyngbya sp. PLA3]|nr:MAG: MFS transporter [Cyanobacteria bacterium CYA]MCE7969656.1 MFS transporter [Leptolyngbya sp. PL-A3]